MQRIAAIPRRRARDTKPARSGPVLRVVQAKSRPGQMRPGTRASVAGPLRAIDWDFPARSRPHAIERIHPYPAKFIPNLPATFLQVLPVPPGTAVFDPFCGSGTTLVEAQRRGLPSVGIDLNPIGCLISRVKTQSLSGDFVGAVARVLKAAQSTKQSEPVEIPNLEHWFKPAVIRALAGLRSAIRAESAGHVKDALRLAFSSIIVRVSNQDSDTRYAAVTKSLSQADVFHAFDHACERLVDALQQRIWQLTPAKVIEADTLTVRARDLGKPVGLVITSPPYPNAYEYWLYHKYRMWWLDLDPLGVKEREIGARAHFFKRNHHTAESFREQMKKVFRLIDDTLVPSGYVCFVVGRSKIHGHIIDNSATLQSIAKDAGMHAVVAIERVIAAHRKSFNLSHANIKTESVLVFQKP